MVQSLEELFAMRDYQGTWRQRNPKLAAVVDALIILGAIGIGIIVLSAPDLGGAIIKPF